MARSIENKTPAIDRNQNRMRMVTPLVDFAPETGSEHDDSDNDSQDLDVPFPQHHRMSAASITRSRSPDSLAESDHGSIQSGFSSIFSGFSRAARASIGSRIAKKHPWEMKGVEPVHHGTHEIARSREILPLKSDRIQSVPVDPGSTQHGQQWEMHDGSVRSEQRSLYVPPERTQRRVSNPDTPYRPVYPTFAFKTENLATRMRRVAVSVDTTPIQPFPLKPTAAQAPRSSLFDTFADYVLGSTGDIPNPSHEEHQFFRTGTNHYDPTTGYILPEAQAAAPHLTLASLFRLQEEEVTDNLHDYAIKEGISSARKTQKVINNTTFEFDAPQGRMATNPVLPFMETNDKNNNWMAAKIGQGLDAKSDSEESESDRKSDVDGFALDEISIGEEYHSRYQRPMDSFIMDESQVLEMVESSAAFHESTLNREGLEQLQDIEHAEAVLKTFQGILEQAEQVEQERLRKMDLKLETGSLPSLMTAEPSIDSLSDHDDDFSLDGKALFEFLELMLDDYEDELKKPKAKSVFELFKWSERKNVDAFKSNVEELEQDFNRISINEGEECLEIEFMSDPLATLDPFVSSQSFFGQQDVFESSPHESTDGHKSFLSNKNEVENVLPQESNKSFSVEVGWSNVEEKKEEKHCIDGKVSKLSNVTSSFEAFDIKCPTSKINPQQIPAIPEKESMPNKHNSNGNMCPPLVHVSKPVLTLNCQGIPMETETINGASSRRNGYDQHLPTNEVTFNADKAESILHSAVFTDKHLEQAYSIRQHDHRNQEIESKEVSEAESAKYSIQRNETKHTKISLPTNLRKNEVLNEMKATNTNATKHTAVSEAYEWTPQKVKKLKSRDSMTEASQENEAEFQEPKQTTRLKIAATRSDDLEPHPSTETQIVGISTKKTREIINEKGISNKAIVENGICLTRRSEINEEIESRQIEASIDILQERALSIFTLPIKRNTSKKGDGEKFSNDNAVESDVVIEGQTKMYKQMKSKGEKLSSHNNVHTPVTSKTTCHSRCEDTCYDDVQAPVLLMGILPITRKNCKKGVGKKLRKGSIMDNEIALKHRSKSHDGVMQPSCDDAGRYDIAQKPTPLLPKARKKSKKAVKGNFSHDNIGENGISLKRRNKTSKEMDARREESTRHAVVQDPSPLTKTLSNVTCANNKTVENVNINEDLVAGEVGLSPAPLENELLAFLYASKLAGKLDRRKKEKMSTELKEKTRDSSNASGNFNDFSSTNVVSSKIEDKARLNLPQDKEVRSEKYQSRSNDFREESPDLHKQKRTIKSKGEKKTAQDSEKLRHLPKKQYPDPRIIVEAGKSRKEAKNKKKKKSEIEGGLHVAFGCDDSLYSRQSEGSKECRKNKVPNEKKDGCCQVKKRNQLVDRGKKPEQEVSPTEGIHNIDQAIETDILRRESSERKSKSTNVTTPKEAEGHLKKRRPRASSVPRTMEKPHFESRFGRATSVDGNSSRYAARGTSTSPTKYEKPRGSKRRSTQTIASGSKSSGSRGSSHRTPPMKQNSEDSIDISPPVFRKAPSRGKPDRKKSH